MEEKTRAMVLRVVKCAGESAVVTVYARQRGVMVFSARLPRSRKAGLRTVLLGPLNILDIAYDYRPGSKFQRFGDMQLAVPYRSIPFDPVKTALVLFLGEALYHALRGEEKNERLFDYLCHGLGWLDGCGRGVANFHLTFLMRITMFLGILPSSEGWFAGACYDLRQCRFVSSLPVGGEGLQPGEAALLPLLLRMNFHTMHVFRFSRAERQRLLDVILLYYRLHVPGFPQLKSAGVLREVLS